MDVAECVSQVEPSFARQSEPLIARGKVIRAGRSLVNLRADVEVVIAAVCDFAADVDNDARQRIGNL